MNRTHNSEARSRYLALINSLIESYRHLDRLNAPADAQQRLLGVIERCRADYNERFPSSALLPIEDRL